MANSNVAIFRDYFKIVKPTEEQVTEWKDSLDSSNPMRKGLHVSFEATHSGFMNDNLRFYIPSRMQDGTSTFINRRKPAKVLKHHKDTSDPVGIVLGAEYIPTIPDYLEHDKNVQILCDSSNSISKQVRAAKNFMKTGVPFSEGWRGLGYTRLDCVLLDEKTIQQVNDSLFDAVSTSFRSPGEAYCSICGQNLVKDGFCEHEIGKQYSDDDDDDDDDNSLVCGIIPGMHKYDEVSLVVFDGDPLTSIKIVHQDSLKDYSVPVEEWKNTSGENTTVFSFRDYKEENTMAGKAEETVISDALKEVVAAVKNLRPELDDEKAVEFAQSLSDAKNEDGKYPYQEEAEIDNDTAFLYALEALEADGEINADAICDEMQVELKAMLDEELISQEEFEAADAKLSAEQRKKLSKSTFCGPEKSFPVPDCAHVTAARRLVGRYKGPGDKSEILACVNRKAKALGCNSKKEDSLESQEVADKFVVPECDQTKTLDDNEARELFNLAEAEMISRGLKLDRPCAACAVHEDAANKAKSELANSEAKIADLENTLTVLREELRYQLADYMEQVDKYVEIGTELTAVKRDHLALTETLSGKFDDFNKAVEAFKDVDISEQYLAAMKDFKASELLGKFNDGMAREPENVVENPVINEDANNYQLPDGLSATAMVAIENIRDFVKDNEIIKAKQLYDKMVMLKVFDNTLVPFESLSADNPKAE